MSALTNDEFEAQLATSREATIKFKKQLADRKAAADAKAKASQMEKEQDVRIAEIVVAAMSQIPIPKDGADGADAEPVNYDIIHDFVTTAVSAIPLPKDGKDGAHGKDGYTPIKGKDYHDGKDADEVTITKTLTKHIEAKTEEVKGHLAKVLKEDTSFIGPEGKAGKDGINGRDGTNGIDGTHGKDGAKGERGEPGRDGNHGKDGLPGPQGLQGPEGRKGTKGDQGAKGLTGKQGLKGKDGRHGKDGKHGKDGIGIKNIHAEGNSLKVSLTDGKVKTLALPRAQGTRSGKVAPISAPEVQDAQRTPINATGIVSSNVRDAIVELKGKIVQSSVGNPFDAGTSEAFMFTFNPYDETHDGSFSYNSNGQLTSKTIKTNSGTVLYTVTFSYNGKQLNGKTILNNINGDSVTVTYAYDTDDRLISKAYTYTA